MDRPGHTKAGRIFVLRHVRVWGLAYEIVWTRAFAISFGNTLLSLSTVVSVYLGGLALGAAAATRVQRTSRFALPVRE